MENPSLLEQLRLPGDIKDLSLDQLNELCDEIRNKIINTVSKNGGHLASNLGAESAAVYSGRAYRTRSSLSQRVKLSWADT